MDVWRGQFEYREGDGLNAETSIRRVPIIVPNSEVFRFEYISHVLFFCIAVCLHIFFFVLPFVYI